MTDEGMLQFVASANLLFVFPRPQLMILQSCALSCRPFLFENAHPSSVVNSLSRGWLCWEECRALSIVTETNGAAFVGAHAG